MSSAEHQIVVQGYVRQRTIYRVWGYFTTMARIRSRLLNMAGHMDTAVAKEVERGV